LRVRDIANLGFEIAGGDRRAYRRLRIRSSTSSVFSAKAGAAVSRHRSGPAGWPHAARDRRPNSIKVVDTFSFAAAQEPAILRRAGGPTTCVAGYKSLLSDTVHRTATRSALKRMRIV
jgi:hypothetical protein